MDNMKLGILLKDGKIVNHRSFIKVILNPIFRYFGFNIATKFDTDTKHLGGITFMKCQKQTKIKWDFDNHNEFDTIEKRRRFI